MKTLLIFMTLLLNACASHNRTVLFLKEKDEYLTDLYENNCLESGYIIAKSNKNGYYVMVTTYSNCSVKKHRKMEEFETQQWRPE